MQKPPNYRDQIAGIIGNLLEHYNSALMGLLGPFLAPLFFEAKDPLTALILIYGMFPLGFLIRPLGSLCFGLIGDHFGRSCALFYSLLGTAATTVSIGLLPLYRDIGFYAPLLLAFCTMLQAFFVAGESTGGAIFVLENTPPAKRGLFSSLFSVSSIAGILLASAAVTLLSSMGWTEGGWRILFWLGGTTAFFGLFIRWKSRWESNEGGDFHPSSKLLKTSWWHVIKEYRATLVSITCVCGFSHVTYAFAFTLMNGYIPLITSLSKTTVMELNTFLLIIDMLLLPLFGFLTHRYKKEEMMLTAALFLTVAAIPLFSLLPNANLTTVLFVRSCILLAGVAFGAPYYAWAIEQVPTQHRYLILSLGSAFATSLIGAPACTVSLLLYKATNLAAAPALYLLLTGLAASFSIYRLFKSATALTRVV